MIENRIYNLTSTQFKSLDRKDIDRSVKIALVHEFDVFKNSEEVTFTKEARGKMIVIEDYLILYMIDTLNWIPSYSKDFIHESFGLDYYGRTYLDEKGITCLGNIIEGWLLLFEQAPEVVELTTDYDIEKGKFDKKKIEKKDILNQLEQLFLLCKKALKEELILVHFGI
ncbi:hypothetical protein [Enterococcus sp. AZ192]|uniref:hypothetical protein n=1 Tax=unclassified Enterococcus TaxID=2608891 RepID=UPI003D2DF439